MKYLKAYEDASYKVGDYIVVQLILEKDLSKHDRIRKAIDKDNIGFAKITMKYYSSMYRFKIKFSNDYEIAISQAEILRKMTSEEIKLFNINKTVIKYNI